MTHEVADVDVPKSRLIEGRSRGTPTNGLKANASHISAIEKAKRWWFTLNLPKGNFVSSFGYFPINSEYFPNLAKSLERKGLHWCTAEGATQTNRAAGIPNLIQLQLKILH